MTGYILRRSGQILVTLFIFFTLAFFLIQAQPGSYASFYSFNLDAPPRHGLRWRRPLAWISPCGSST